MCCEIEIVDRFVIVVGFVVAVGVVRGDKIEIGF